MACSEFFAKAIMDLSLGESEIHANVCHVQDFFEGLFNTSMQFRFSYLIINTETLVPLLKF